MTGGTPPYLYQWSNGFTTTQITGLYAGADTGTIVDAQGCSTSVTAIVNQPVRLSVVASATGVTCAGGANGSVTGTVTGGTSPYTFWWSNGVNGQNLTNVAPGIYDVTATDQNGCTATDSAMVNAGSQIVVTDSVTNANCYGTTGSVALTITGGTAPYVYEWSNGGATVNISNVSAGTYNVTITDANGCSAIASGTVNTPQQIVSSALAVAVTCFGATDGRVTLTTIGGTPPYLYQWSNGATTQNLINLPAGTDSVIVTDSHGCTGSVSVTVDTSVLLFGSPSAFNVTCFGGSTGAITLAVTGGTPPYAYNWSNGATTQNIANLIAAAYEVTVTDSVGCSAITNAVVNSAIQIVVTDSVTNSTNCFGATPNGAAVVYATGGTSPFSYLWSNSATNAGITNIGYNTYYVTVTDAHGCSVTDSARVGGRAQFTDAFTLTPDSAVQHKWYLNYTFTGSFPESFLWIWGDGDTSSGPAPSHTYSDSGYYDICIILTDSFGCTASYCDSSTFLRSGQQTVIGVVVIPPPQINTAVQKVKPGEFVVYPNPADKILHLKTDMAANIRYQVFNSLGQLLMQNESTASYFDIDINMLSNGLYFVRLETDAGEITERFIKQ